MRLKAVAALHRGVETARGCQERTPNSTRGDIESLEQFRGFTCNYGKPDHRNNINSLS